MNNEKLKKDKKIENFSYSKMDTFVQCGFKYKLIYVDGHYLYTGNIATEFGTLIHQTEEAIATAIKENKIIDYTHLKNNIILQMFYLEHKYPQAFYERDKSDRTYKDKVYYYLDFGIYRLEQFMKLHPTYTIVGIEQKFETAFSDKYHFKGAIDRIFFDTATNTYIVQDIKTYAVPVEHKNLTTPLQFVFYSIAAKDLFKCDYNNIRCQYDLPLCDLTQDAGTNGYVERGLKKINQLLSDIENKNFVPNPTPLCHWCNFCPTNPNQPEAGKNLCPYYLKWTKEHKTFAKGAEWQGIENHELVLNEYLKLSKGGEN